MLQNKFLRMYQFCSKTFPTSLLYSNAKILKLVDMINMEFAKFLSKYTYNNQMLLGLFDNCFLKLENVRKYNTRPKKCNKFYQTYISSASRKKSFNKFAQNRGKQFHIIINIVHFHILKLFQIYHFIEV